MFSRVLLHPIKRGQNNALASLEASKSHVLNDSQSWHYVLRPRLAGSWILEVFFVSEQLPRARQISERYHFEPLRLEKNIIIEQI